MKAILKTVLVLVGCVLPDPAFAQQPKPRSEAASVSDTIKQRVRDWADAMVAGDVDKVSQILADDWIDGYPGKVTTKASFLDDLKTGKHKFDSFEFGPMDVKVLGHVAVIQGSIAETKIKDGQSVTVRVAFMDVFEKRGDKWVAVRSHAKKI